MAVSRRQEMRIYKVLKNNAPHSLPACLPACHIGNAVTIPSSFDARPPHCGITQAVMKWRGAGGRVIEAAGIISHPLVHAQYERHSLREHIAVCSLFLEDQLLSSCLNCVPNHRHHIRVKKERKASWLGEWQRRRND